MKDFKNLAKSYFCRFFGSSIFLFGNILTIIFFTSDINFVNATKRINNIRIVFNFPICKLVWLNPLTNSEWFFLRNLFRHKLMNILTILIRNLIKMVIGMILARFLGNIITLVIGYIITLIIGDLVAFLVGFLNGSVF